MPPEIRQQIRDKGLRQADVREIYSGLRKQQREDLEWEWSIRRRVWEMHAYSVDSRSFWRHGMWVKYRAAFSEGDMTNIPGWDLTAQSIYYEFPGLAEEEEVSQKLFELIRAHHTPMPSIAATWQQAIAACETETAAVPF